MSDESASSPRLLGVKTVAGRLGVCAKTVRRMIERHELPVYRIGHLLRLSEADVENYLAAQRQSMSNLSK